MWPLWLALSAGVALAGEPDDEALDALYELVELVGSSANDPAGEELVVTRFVEARRAGWLSRQQEHDLVEELMDLAGERLVKHLGRDQGVPDWVSADPAPFVLGARARARRAERRADRAYRRARGAQDARATACGVRRLLQLQQLRELETPLLRVYRRSTTGSSAREVVLARLVVLDKLMAQRGDELERCLQGVKVAPVAMPPCDADLSSPSYDEFTGDFLSSSSCDLR